MMKKIISNIVGKLRIGFTNWYIRKGYTVGYDENGCTVWNCPRYIRPLLFLYSPYIGFMEQGGKYISDGFWEGFNSVSKGEKTND